MKQICFYFQVHQPYRLRRYTFFELGRDHAYFNETLNRNVLRKVARKCYLPGTQLLLKLQEKFGSDLQLGFSITGTALEQIEEHAPLVLERLQQLAGAGHVEMLGESYYHSLSYFYSLKEFERQVKMHAELISRIFGLSPSTFRNTELSYDAALSETVKQLGYQALLTEAIPEYLHDRHPNQLFYSANSPDHFPLLLRNDTFSDDIGFRYSDPQWKEYPLSPERFVSWLKKAPGSLVNLFLDFETFGEHHWEDTGIFEFLKRVLMLIIQDANMSLITPSAVATHLEASEPYQVDQPISWADYERDLSAWSDNEMQRHALRKVYELEDRVKQKGDATMLTQWSRLTSSDHFYYISTKGYTDGMVHDYFSPYPSAYDGYIYYMNALSDLELRL